MKEFLQCLSRGDLTTAMALFAAVAVRILFAVFLWWLGRKVIRKILTLLERGLAVRQQKGMDAGLAKFLASLCKVGMYTILFVMLFELLGLPSHRLRPSSVPPVWPSVWRCREAFPILRAAY